MDRLNGYTEVTLNGQTYAIKFGMGAWAIIAEERGKALEDMFDGLNDFSFIAWIAYAGMKFAKLAGYTDNAPDSVYQVMDLLNDADEDTMKQIGQTFRDSRTVGKTMADYIAKMQGGDTDNKKKRSSPK